MNACQEVCDNSECQECCDHYDRDCYSCFQCGKDMTEDTLARAYDLIKGSKGEGY